jgi:hypothetical protein
MESDGAIYYHSLSPESTRTTLPLRVQAAPAFAGVFFRPRGTLADGSVRSESRTIAASSLASA